MKKFWIIAATLFVVACNVDPRSNIERARDKADACKELGGTPVLQETALGAYVKCEITP